jgi:signal transduction histidine kinase
VRGNAGILRRHALRTAGLATALVAVALAGVLTATDLLVSHNLTSSVDQRLVQWLDLAGKSTPGQPIAEVAPDRDFDEPLLTWIAPVGGTCRPLGTAPALPAQLCTAVGPFSAEVSGVPFRLEGRQLAGGSLMVAGESLAPAARQLDDLVLAELVVGPVLLVLVFLGALGVGSRVGGSVERMRRRQLAFTADASHELRTPLSVMKAETDVALAGSDRSLRPALARVSGEIGRMRSIVEDLLWLARFDSEPQPPPPATLDLVTAGRLAAERFSALATRRGLRLDVDTPDRVLPVSIPAEWLDRLTGVLVDNACRHAESRVTVGVRQRTGRRVELSVADDGEGVPDAELSRIFDRFHRATSRGEGAGLGLAIADSIVRSTSGRWEVTGVVGGGIRFAVVWPLARASGPAVAARRLTSPAGRPSR